MFISSVSLGALTQTQRFPSSCCFGDHNDTKVLTNFVSVQKEKQKQRNEVNLYFGAILLKFGMLTTEGRGRLLRRIITFHKGSMELHMCEILFFFLSITHHGVTCQLLGPPTL